MNFFQAGREATPEEALNIFPLLMAGWIECMNLILEGLQRVDELAIVHVILGGENEVNALLEWAEKVRPIAVAASDSEYGDSPSPHGTDDSQE